MCIVVHTPCTPTGVEIGPPHVHCLQAELPLQLGGGGSTVMLLFGMLLYDRPASASSDMIRWSGVLLSHTLDAARSY